MTFLAWNWLKRNLNLVMALTAIACLAWALGEIVRGATWSLLMPVSLAAVVCGWGIGASRLNPKQAWLSLTVLGLPGAFMYVAGLIRPLGRTLLSLLSLFPQVVLWMSERAPVDASPLLDAWGELTVHLAGVLSRTWEWSIAFFAGRPFVDPLATGLAWCMLLWLVGAWAGWGLRWNRQALAALTPGAALLALVLDYTGDDVSLLVVYLAILLALMGVARDEWRHADWEQRKVDYAESIRLDTLLMVGMVTIALTLSAAGMPSLSWRDLVEKLREKNRGSEGQVAESLGLEQQPNIAADEAFLSDGLPRRHLLGLPPEQLEEVVMRVRTGELPPIPDATFEIQPERHYWRSITYNVYTAAGWGSSAAQEIPLPANTPLLDFPQGYRRLNQQIDRTPGQGRYVYWTGLLTQVNADIDIAWRTEPPSNPDPIRNGDMLGALTAPDEYTVVSYVPQIDVSRLRATGSDYPVEIARRYLALPEETPERVLALSRELTQAAATPYDRAAAIEAYLRTFPYTLDVPPPPPGRDVADYFLFTLKKGYCDYYATAMIVLARAAGLPARLVVGYASGEYDASAAEYIVRQKNAHSWVEVYFSGIGWVEFEPTAGQPVLIRMGEVSASEPSPGLPAGELALAWLKTSWRALVTSLGGQFLLAVLGSVLLLALWQMGEIGFLHLIPSRKAITRMYSRMEMASKRLLPDLPSGHTPGQLRTALSLKLKGGQNEPLQRLFSPASSEIERVVALYEAQVFSARPPGKSKIKEGIRAWSRLRWRLWVASRWL